MLGIICRFFCIRLHAFIFPVHLATTRADPWTHRIHAYHTSECSRHPSLECFSNWNFSLVRACWVRYLVWLEVEVRQPHSSHSRSDTRDASNLVKAIRGARLLVQFMVAPGQRGDDIDGGSSGGSSSSSSSSSSSGFTNGFTNIRNSSSSSSSDGSYSEIVPRPGATMVAAVVSARATTAAAAVVSARATTAAAAEAVSFWGDCSRGRFRTSSLQVSTVMSPSCQQNAGREIIGDCT